MLSAVSVVVPVVSRAFDASRRRDDRRLRRVEREPLLATAGDLALLVRAHGVSDQLEAAVAARFEAGGISPEIAWRWTMEFDGTELAYLCVSQLTDLELASVLSGSDRWSIAG